MIKTPIKFDMEKVLKESLDIMHEKGTKAAVDHFVFETGWLKKDAKRYLTDENFRKAHQYYVEHGHREGNTIKIEM